MEVHFAPDVETQLKDLARQSGCGTADKLVQDVIAGYFDELTRTREMLDSRYDDLKSGRANPFPATRLLPSSEKRARSLAGRARFMIANDFHPEARLDLDELWEIIREDHLDAADRLIAEVLYAIDALVPFPGRGHRRPDLTSHHFPITPFFND
jgi:hypothetical protein